MSDAPSLSRILGERGIVQADEEQTDEVFVSQTAAERILRTYVDSIDVSRFFSNFTISLTMRFVSGTVPSLCMLAMIRIGLVRSFVTWAARPVLATQLPRAAFYSTKSQQLSMSKMDQSFSTWSFDKPCRSMAWTELVKASITTGTSYEDADLVLVGVIAPPAEEKDDDDDEDPVPTVTFMGMAKTLDLSLSGALTELCEENAKTFKNGATPGSTTPTLRVVTPGGKVSTTFVLYVPLVVVVVSSFL